MGRYRRAPDRESDQPYHDSEPYGAISTDLLHQVGPRIAGAEHANYTRTVQDGCVQPEIGNPDAVGHDDGQQPGHDHCRAPSHVRHACKHGALPRRPGSWFVFGWRHGSHPRTTPDALPRPSLRAVRVPISSRGTAPLPRLTSRYEEESRCAELDRDGGA